MPVEESLLASISAFEIKEFRKCWRAVKPLFFESDGRLTHHRVMDGRERLEAWHESRREAGRKGGQKSKPRSTSAQAQLETNGKHSLSSASSKSEANSKPSSSSSSSTSSLRSENTPPPQRATRQREAEPDPAQLVRDAVEECAKVWPNIGDKRFAVASWEREAAQSARGVQGWCEAIVGTAKQHAPAQIAAKSANSRHFIPTLDRWVSSGDYTSPPPSVIEQVSGRHGKKTAMEIVRERIELEEQENANK